MSFQVKFGSVPSLLEGNATPRGHQVPGGDAQERHGHRGRGKGQRGRGNRGRRPKRGAGGGELSAKDVDNSEDNDGSGDSDGTSSVTSESQEGRRGRGGRWRGQGGRGRGGKSRSYSEKGNNFDQYQGSHSDQRSPSEATPVPAQQEIHIHYHSLPQAPPQHAHLGYPSQQPLAPRSGCLPYSFQPGPQLPSNYNAFPSPTGNIQQPYPPNMGQSYQQAYPPPQMFGERRSSQPCFNLVPPPVDQPGIKPLLNTPPPLLGQSRDQSTYQKASQGLTHEQQPQIPPGRSAGSARENPKNLNQEFSGQRSDGSIGPKQKGQEKRGSYGQKPSRSEKPDKKKTDKKPAQKNEPEQPPKNDDKVEIPDLSPDEWIKIFNLLLKNFMGRTKLGTLLSQKGDLFKGLSHSQAAAWLKHSNRFLTFEKNGQVRFVSVYFKDARLCFKYKKHNTDKCENDSCQYFHVCRDFVAGNCPRQSSCHFNHSFHTGSNAKVCTEVGLQAFTDEDIRIIVLRSTLEICAKFNKGGCNDDCPDLHVCAQFIRNNCSDESCKFGHNIKGTEHNDWILGTFHMQKIHESTLRKMVITLREQSMQDGDTGKLPPSSDILSREAMCKKHQNKNPPVTQYQSQENLLGVSDSSAHTSAKQEISTPAAKKPQHRKPKTNKVQNNDSAMKASSSSDILAASGVAEDMAFSQQVPFSQQKKDHQVSDTTGSMNDQQKAPAKMFLSRRVTAANTEGEEQPSLPASHYSHLCELHTWTNSCSRGYTCGRYHHRHRPPFTWQLHALGDWNDFSDMDSIDIEQRFCGLQNQVVFEVILDNFGGMQLSLDFDIMTAKVVASSISTLAPQQILKLRRWSTPSYVESDAEVPLSYYTQWTWYHLTNDVLFEPFIPGTLQYTVEKKYHSGQQKYYFEVGEERFLLYLQEKRLVNFSQDITVPVLRRPFSSVPHDGSTTPTMSPLLLNESPNSHCLGHPSHWGSIDIYQDFEMVELDTSSSEYLDVERSFHSTLSQDRSSIIHVFRVQNPSLWDKYCSTKRSMTPRGGLAQEVDERKLFHGTPTLLAARGICTNNMDFRRAGENVGAKFGRGSYFSAHALYSHSYTQGPDRYMFLAKVLVGKFTKGHESYNSPPVREGLKLYDSCVNDEANPTIFVIFDLAQSYPEYLIQYIDAEMGPHGHVQSVKAPRTVSDTGFSGSGGRSVAGTSASALFPVSDVPKAPSSPAETSGDRERYMKHFTQQFKEAARLDSDTSSAAYGKLEYQNPYSQASGFVGASRPDQQDPFNQASGFAGAGRPDQQAPFNQASGLAGAGRPDQQDLFNQTVRELRSSARSFSRNTKDDKCLIS